MFKIAKKQVSRVGSHQVKVLFQVEIRSLNLPKAKTKDISTAEPISICFERGGKMATSKDIVLTEHPGGDMRAEPRETLSLVATLYRISDGSFQPKKGRVVVRQKKKSRIGVDYKGLGEVPLALEVLAGDLQTQHMTMHLQRCTIEGASVTLAITARYLNDMGETMSVMSGFSEASADAADFNSYYNHSVIDEEDELNHEMHTSSPGKHTPHKKMPSGGSTGEDSSTLEARYNELAANFLSRSQECERLQQTINELTPLKNKVASSDAKILELQKQLELANKFLAQEQAKSAAKEEATGEAADIAAANERIAAMAEDLTKANYTIRHMQEMHEQELQHKDDTLADLQNEKQQLEREILQLQNDIDVLNQRAVRAEDNADRESEIEALRDEIAKLKEQQIVSDSVAQEINDLRVALTEREEIIASLTTEKSSILEENSMLTQKNAEAKATIVKLTESSEAAVAKWRKRIDELQHAVNESHATIDNLLAEVKSASEESDKTVLSLRQEILEYQTKLQEAANENSALTKSVEVGESTIADLKEQIMLLGNSSDSAVSKWREQVDELQQAARESRITIDDLRQQLIDVQAKLEEAESDQLSMQQAIRELETKLEIALKDNSELAQFNTENEKVIATLKEQVTTLSDASESALETWKLQIVELQNSNEESQLTINALRQQVAEAEARSEAHNTKLETVVNENTNLTQRNIEAEQLIITLKEQISELSNTSETAVHTWKQQIDDLQESLRASQMTIDSLRQQVKEAESAATESKMRVTSLTQKVQEQEAIIEEARNETTEAEKTIADLRQQISLLTETSDTAVSTWRQQIEELQNAAVESSATISELRRQVNEAKQAAQVAESSASSLREDQQSAANEIIMLVQCNKSAETTIEDLEAQISQLREASETAVSTWQQQIHDLRIAATESKATIDRLQQQVSDSQAAAAEAEKNVVSLQKEIQEREAKMEAETDEWKWKLADAIFKSEQAQERLQKDHEMEVIKLQGENNDLKVTISTLEDQVSALEDRIRGVGSSSEQEKAALELDAMKAKTVAENLRTEVAKHEETIDRLLQEKALSAETHLLAEDSNRSLRRDLDKAQELNADLEQRLSVVTLEKDSLLATLSNVAAERDKLLETNEELGEKLSVELEAVKMYYDGNIATLENEKQQLEREILQLQNDIDVLNQRAVAAEDNADRESEMEALRDEIAKLKEQLAVQQADSLEQSEAKDATLMEQTAKIAELEKTVSMLEHKLNEQKETSAGEYVSIAEALKLNEKEFKKAQQELKSVQEQLIDSVTERERLREEVQVLKIANKENDDHQSIVEELIAAKMQIAASAMEQDELQKKVHTYKRKVQMYAERITAMEVAAAEKKLNAKEKMKKMFRKGDSSK